MVRPLIRSLAFLSNWVAWVIRQPSMLLTMIIGPFVILGLFALSNATQSPRAEVVVVRPPGGGESEQIPTETLSGYFDVTAETEDGQWAREQLRLREVDAVLVLPPDARTQIAQGRQAQIEVQTNEIDPITLAFLKADLRSQIAELNKALQQRNVEAAKEDASDVERRLEASALRLNTVERDADNADATRAEVQRLDQDLSPALDRVPLLSATARAASVILPRGDADPIVEEVSQAERTAAGAKLTLEALKAEANAPQPNPERIRELSRSLRGQLGQLRAQVGAVQRVPTTTIVQPFEGKLEQIAPIQPTIVTYYAPAALALLLQHFAVTLAALSMVRARILGMVEFWRIAPIRASEIIAGNYLSYGILSMVAWAALTVAVVYVLGVPVLGSLAQLVGAAALLILASLGIGFVISLLASNEQQAAQLAMLVLLGSVFLSGFVRPLESVDYPVRYVSYLLPATFGIQLFQDIMLRGLAAEYWYLPALGVLALLGLAFSVFLFRRELRPA